MIKNNILSEIIDIENESINNNKNEVYVNINKKNNSKLITVIRKMIKKRGGCSGTSLTYDKIIILCDHNLYNENVQNLQKIIKKIMPNIIVIIKEKIEEECNNNLYIIVSNSNNNLDFNFIPSKYIIFLVSVPIPNIFNTQQYMYFLKKSICIWISFDITQFNVNKEINIHNKIYCLPWWIFENENRVLDKPQNGMKEKEKEKEKEKADFMNKEKSIFHISKCLYSALELETNFININYTLKKNTLYCLHLLETPNRMEMLKKQDILPDFEIFPAIKYPISWKGCGFSYQNLIYNAKRCNLNKITIFEDDCLFKKDFNQNYKIINTFLDTCSNWDIFVGCLASLPDDTIFYNMYEYKGLIFLEVNKMHSTVFNIYNKTSYDIILDWNRTDTIDVFIKNKNLKNIITYPFHFSITNVESTLWASKNTYKRYLNLFEESLKIIENKIKLFITNRIKKSDILKITYGIKKKNSIDITSVIFNIIKRQNLLYGDNFLIHNFINDPYVNKPKKMFIYTVEKIIIIHEHSGKLKGCIYFE